MTVVLNHTIVRVRDKKESAHFLTDLLGLSEPTTYGPFLVVQLGNDVSLDFADDHGPADPQHYAFLVSEEEFDGAFGRLTEGGHEYWADPGATEPGQINRHDGGRGCYFRDPDGHWLEILTVPYGGWPS